jgi:predicted DNA-binding ribbon-helix-helix protein
MKAPQRKRSCRSQASSVDPVSFPAMPTTGIKPEFKTKPKMKSLIVKRSVVLGGHKTSVSLKDAFWKSLKGIAASGKMTVSELLTAIDSGPRCGFFKERPFTAATESARAFCSTGGRVGSCAVL